MSQNMPVGNDARVLMEYDIAKKSMVLAYLLWWFLGSLGVHRFYLGKTGSGAAMLGLFVVSLVLTVVAIGLLGFLVLGIWWLVDGFLVYAIVKEHNTRLMQRLAR